MSILYHQFCRTAFEFCITFNRPKEFRKFYDYISSHLKLIIMHSSAPNDYNEKFRVNWNFQTAEDHLETRFVMLDTALKLKSYEVCFYVIQDIHSIIEEISQRLLKEDPRYKNANYQALRPGNILKYYEKLSEVFWISKNYLYHAFSRLKYLQLYKSHKKYTEEKKEINSIALLAALSIPLIVRNGGNDYNYSSLLNLKETIPTVY